MPPFSIIVAVDEKFGIAREGNIPWHLPADLKRFKEITVRTETSDKQNILVMGRQTWDSLPGRFRPLPGRINLVLSRNAALPLPAGVLRAGSLEDALTQADALRKRLAEQVFVIGGGQLYREALIHPLCRRILLTRIHRDFHCDVFFPSDLLLFRESSRSPLMCDAGLEYEFLELLRP